MKNRIYDHAVAIKRGVARNVCESRVKGFVTLGTKILNVR